MAPEQARGEGEALGPWTDIYALGATLYEILSGRPPYAARSAMLTVVKVVMGELPPLLPEDPDALAGSRSSLYTPEGGLPIPVELAAVCERAMAREPEDRHASAEDLAEDIQAWLEGSRRRQRARDLTAEAFVLEAQVEGLRNTAREFQDEADDLLSATNPWEPEDRKQAGWALEDRARSARRMARFRELEVEHKLDVALWHADLPEVHENLARLFQQRHQAAEAAGEDTRRSELRIRQHAEALPRSQRGPFLDYLEGAGLLTLETDRPVQAKLFRYRKQRRRLVPVFERDLGTTPLQRVRLDRGSYLLLLGEVPYPVLIRRGEHWDRVPPGEQAAQAIVVSECLGSDECVVPAGWFLSGDPTGTALPPRRLWCDRFVIQRQPVTNAEYLVFLNDLVASGREADALRWVPRDRGGAMDGSDGVMFYGRSPHGFFELVPDGDGDQWEPDYPVLAVDLASAMAYAAWLRQRTGQPWRLPSELEWEKAARGVDGRQHPWGDFFDPSWACGLQSRELRPLPAHVHEFPTDESPYGVRGLQGNARDWCRDVHRDEGPSVEGDRVRVPAPHPLGPNTLGVQRGGSWSDRSSGSLAWRIQANHRKRYTNTSFRLVR